MASKTNREGPTKKRIIKAFSKCIREKGIASVTMRNIAEKANVSLGTIHYYFRSKENLIVELLNYELDYIEHDIKRRFKSADPPDKKLQAIFDEGRDFIGDELFIAFIESWTVSLRNKKMKKSFFSFYERLSAIIGEVITDGKKQGVFDNVREDLVANAMIAFVEGIGLQMFIRGKSSANFTETFDFVVANLNRLLKKD